MLQFKKNNADSLFFATFFIAIMLLCSTPPKILENHPELYIIGVKSSIILFSVYALILAFKFFRIARVMQDTPTSKIRSCAQGFVELSGMQDNLPGNEIISILSKKTCTWYSYSIEKYVRGEKSGYWTTIQEGESNECFQIDDGTGTCIIDPTGAQINTNLKLTWKGFRKFPEYAPNKRNAFLAIFSIFGNYRYTEYYMLPKTPIYTMGMFNTENQQNYLSNKMLPSDAPFLISAIPEKTIVKQYKFKGMLYVILFVLIAASYPLAVKYYTPYFEYLIKHRKHY